MTEHTEPRDVLHGRSGRLTVWTARGRIWLCADSEYGDEDIEDFDTEQSAELRRVLLLAEEVLGDE